MKGGWENGHGCALSLDKNLVSSFLKMTNLVSETIELGFFPWEAENIKFNGKPTLKKKKV